MKNAKKAVPAVPATFAPNLMKLAVAAIQAEGKAEAARITFFKALVDANVLPSKIKEYVPSFQLAALMTFPKKVQESIASNLFQQKDIINCLSSSGVKLTKIEWMNQKNKKGKRWAGQYCAWVENTYVEKAGKLVLRHAGLPEEKGAGTRKRPFPVRSIETVFKVQQEIGNMDTPSSWHLELNKVLLQAIDLIKGNNNQALATFNRLSTAFKDKKKPAKKKPAKK
jgi:hypothetical protein